MKAYLAIKYYEQGANRDLIESVSEMLREAGLEVTVMARDYELFGERKFDPKELMDLTFEVIRNVDMIVLDLSEKGVGLGIEAGYAHALGKPILVVAKMGSDVSSTLSGIADKVLFYDKPRELVKEVKNFLGVNTLRN